MVEAESLLGPAAAGQPSALRRPLGVAKGIGQFARRRPVGAVCALVILLLLAVAIAAPLVAQQDPLATHAGVQLESPSRAHLFGTDDLGRDVFSRVVYGGQVSLWIAFSGMVLALVGGTAIAVVSGYFGGITDLVIQRFVDAFHALPGLLVILTVVTLLTPSITNLILLLGTFSAIGESRLIRSQVLMVKGLPFIDASRSLGAGHLRIMFHDILPNVMNVVIVVGSFVLVQIILAEATLSFLGFGVPPPNPSWGQMLSGSARVFMVRAPWMGLAPGIALSVAVLAFNLLGDAIRDELDPRLRGA